MYVSTSGVRWRMLAMRIFSRPIALLISACWSAVSGWAVSYLGCFFAYAQAAIKARSRNPVGIFRKIMLTPDMNLYSTGRLYLHFISSGDASSRRGDGLLLR